MPFVATAPSSSRTRGSLSRRGCSMPPRSRCGATPLRWGWLVRRATCALTEPVWLGKTFGAVRSVAASPAAMSRSTRRSVTSNMATRLWGCWLAMARSMPPSSRISSGWRMLNFLSRHYITRKRIWRVAPHRLSVKGGSSPTPRSRGAGRLSATSIWASTSMTSPIRCLVNEPIAAIWP